MKRRFALVIALALAVPVFVNAQTQGSHGGDDSVTTTTTTTVKTSTSTSTGDREMHRGTGIGFGPVVGWYDSRDASSGHFTGGLALRMKLSPFLGVEGSLTYRQERYHDGAVTVSSWPVQVTGLIYPLPVVYGAVGAGWYHTTVDYDVNMIPGVDPSETKSKFGWHFGGGLEVPMGQASFTADIRYVFLNYDFKQLPGTGGTNSDFFVISAGILFGL